jgi:Tfp pilus assembly protein PilN
MLGNIKHSLLGITKIAGIEIILQPEGKKTMNLVVLSVQKNMLYTENKKKGISSFDELKECLSPEVPVSLALNGRGILHKKIHQAQEAQGADLGIHLVMPNANAEDFYIQHFPGAKGECFVSIVRKNMLDEVMQEFHAHGFFVIDAGLGPFAASYLYPVFEDKKINLPVAGFTLTFQEGQVKDFSSGETIGTEKDISLGSEKIPVSLLLAYSAAFRVNLPGLESTLVNNPQINALKEEFRHKKIFRIFGWGSLIFLLTALLINFLLFDHYSKKNNELLAKESMYRGMVTRMDTLQKKVNEKESFLEEAGWLDYSRASFYSDRIASTVPASVKLNKLSVNPADDKRSRSERKLIFNKGQVKISGTCSKPTDLNVWIRRIQKMNWVSAVEIENYFYDNKIRSGNFYLLIKVK